jgi:hypothetical protein
MNTSIRNIGLVLFIVFGIVFFLLMQNSVRFQKIVDCGTNHNERYYTFLNSKLNGRVAFKSSQPRDWYVLIENEDGEEIKFNSFWLYNLYDAVNLNDSIKKEANSKELLIQKKDTSFVLYPKKDECE